MNQRNAGRDTERRSEIANDTPDSEICSRVLFSWNSDDSKSAAIFLFCSPSSSSHSSFCPLLLHTHKFTISFHHSEQTVRFGDAEFRCIRNCNQDRERADRPTCAQVAPPFPHPLQLCRHLLCKSNLLLLLLFRQILLIPVQTFMSLMTQVLDAGKQLLMFCIFQFSLQADHASDVELASKMNYMPPMCFIRVPD